MKLLWSLLLGVALSVSVAQAQIQIPGTDFTLTPVNGGTGGLVSVPIPGGAGLSVTVGTGSAAIPLQDIRNNANAVNITTWDDWYNEVPLGFTFPFYGQNFTTSWAMTNGLVTFQNPATSGLGGACCEGVDLRTTRDSRYNYTIYGMHTDLYSWNGQNQYYLRGTNEMTYGWYNLSQCCSSNGGNSFEIKINSSGLIDTRIAGAMVSWNRVTSGMAGDLSKGEYFQAYHGQGINITPGSSSIFSWQALGGTGAVDMCTINPLSSPSCPGYQAAYTVQQCTISALYDPTCPGYAAAYLTQQCSANPLFSQQCPGYQAAYLDQQCSINPLYSTTCSGYQQAYHQQQCSLNSLYATDCPGYAAAYLDQQCSINALYSTTCSGYAAAYLAQQCALDGLYDRTCPNYADAYARRYVLGIPSSGTISYGPADSRCTVGCDTSNTLNTNAGPATSGYSGPGATNVSTTQPVTSISNSGQISTGVAVTNDSNVNAVIATPKMDGPAASTGNSPVASSMNSPGPAASGSSTQTANAGPATRQEQKSEDKRDDAPKSTGGSSPSQNTNTTQASSDKPAAPTARQALQERREAAAKAAAVEQGKNLANEMGKAADMESQKQVQNVVIQAMGFTPGFDAYGKTVIPDGVGYRPYTVYNNQKNIDNRANLRMWTGTDKLHNDMVDSQYNREK